jgi:hypothetical protein
MLPKELEDGTTQYQGEIERFLEQVGFRHRLEALFRSDYLSVRIGENRPSNKNQDRHKTKTISASTTFKNFIVAPFVWPNLIDGIRARKLSRLIPLRDEPCVTYAEANQLLTRAYWTTG